MGIELDSSCRPETGSFVAHVISVLTSPFCSHDSRSRQVDHSIHSASSFTVRLVMLSKSLGLNSMCARIILLILLINVDGWANDPPLAELEQSAFQAATLFAQDSVVQVETFGGSEIVNQQLTASGPSTGTILTSDGWIITSTFQFRGQPASITVVLPDQQRKAAKLVARDLSRELALLKIDVDAPLRPIQVSDPNAWKVGQWVMALGKTFDTQNASCSVGILSALGRVWNKAIQTDAKVSPQNYGGPILDLNGRAMGILTPINPGIVTEGEVEQWYDSGIGFAIPLRDVLDRLSRLQQGEDIYPGKLGIRWRGKDEYSEPVVLHGVSPGSPAAKIGIRKGDRVVGLGIRPDAIATIENHSQFKHAIGTVDAGQNVIIAIDRQGEKLSFECMLVKDLPVYREPYLGVLIDPNGEASEPSSAQIGGVLPESPAAKAGLKVGETLQSIQGTKIDAENSLESILGALDFRETVDIVVRDGAGETRTVSVSLQPRPENDLEWDYRLTRDVDTEGDATKDSPRGTIQLPLGDVKNKAFALVPSTYQQKVPHGLLVIFGDAGSQNQAQWSTAWENFIREHRWIVVVAQSAEEKGWTFDEAELGLRLQSYMTQNYTIDRRRIAVGGIGSGSLLAYITSVQMPGVFRGVWLSNPKLPPRLRVPSTEPFRSAHFFVNGSDKSIDKFVEMARNAGYSVQSVSTELDASKLIDSPVLGPLQRWLRLLEAY